MSLLLISVLVGRRVLGCPRVRCRVVVEGLTVVDVHRVFPAGAPREGARGERQDQQRQQEDRAH